MSQTALEHLAVVGASPTDGRRESNRCCPISETTICPSGLPDEGLSGAHDWQFVKRCSPSNLDCVLRTSTNKRQRYRVTSAEAAVTTDATIQTGLVSARR